MLQLVLWVTIWFALLVPTTWEIQQYQNEIEFWDSQYEIINEQYIYFSQSLWRIERNPIWLWENWFSCVWVMKAFAVAKWIMTQQEAKTYNSQWLYSISDPKNFFSAATWDYIRFQLVDGTWYHHWATVRSPYSWWYIEIFDNIGNYMSPRSIRVSMINGNPHYVLEDRTRRLHIAENPIVKLAKNRQMVFDPLWKDMWDRWISRYYSYQYWQENTSRDFIDWERRKRTHEEERFINCSWDCQITASGKRYNEWDEWKYVACPPEYDFGTVFYIEWYWEVECVDRWWAIKWKRLDLRVGIWDDWYKNIFSEKYLFDFQFTPRKVYVKWDPLQKANITWFVFSDYYTWDIVQ